MADNTQLNPGLGGHVMSDEDIGGVHVPRVKIITGAAGVDDGDVTSLNPLPVTGTVFGIMMVEGRALDAAPPIGNPVWVAGWDGADVRALDVDALGRASTRIEGWFGSVAPTVGQKAMAASLPVVIASDQTAVPTTPVASNSTSVTRVAASATNVSLLAANPARLGATVVNESDDAGMVVKCGVTASATSYTVPIAPGGYWEVPFNYKGQLDAIWESASGAAEVTEFT